MKIETRKGKFVASLTQKELDKLTNEFDGLIRLRDNLGYVPKWVPRIVKLATLIDGLNEELYRYNIKE